MTLFINDYSEGCHERILEALTRTNRVQTTGYGTDPYCAEARDILRREMACRMPISGSYPAAPRPISLR